MYFIHTLLAKHDSYISYWSGVINTASVCVYVFAYGSPSHLVFFMSWVLLTDHSVWTTKEVTVDWGAPFASVSSFVPSSLSIELHRWKQIIYSEFSSDEGHESMRGNNERKPLVLIDISAEYIIEKMLGTTGVIWSGWRVGEERNYHLHFYHIIKVEARVSCILATSCIFSAIVL